MRPSKEDIDAQLDKALVQVNAGSTTVRGMTYEDGVDATIRWMNGDTDDKPMDE